MKYLCCATHSNLEPSRARRTPFHRPAFHKDGVGLMPAEDFAHFTIPSSSPFPGLMSQQNPTYGGLQGPPGPAQPTLQTQLTHLSSGLTSFSVG